jgi:hypothetical protein
MDQNFVPVVDDREGLHRHRPTGAPHRVLRVLGRLAPGARPLEPALKPSGAGGYDCLALLRREKCGIAL